MRELNKRFSNRLLSFACAAAMGMASVLLVESVVPGFTGTEAAPMVGRRVSNRYGTDGHALAKCPPAGGACSVVEVGEYGKVIGMMDTSAGGFFLVVQWDEANGGEPLLSYIGRKSRRTFLAEE
jgi:hypothetical protein